MKDWTRGNPSLCNNLPADPGDGSGGGGGGGGGGAAPPVYLTQLAVRRNDTNTGNLVSFAIATTSGVSAFEVWRAFSNSVAASVFVGAVTLSIGARSLNDTSSLIGSNNCWYWVKVWNSTRSSYTLYGPAAISNAVPIQPPAVDMFDISHNASSGGLVRININIRPNVNASGQSFRIYVNGYLGINRDVLIHQTLENLSSMSLQATEENVTFKCTTVSNDGKSELLIASAAVKVLALGAVATRPAKLPIVKATEFKSGVQVDFLTGKELGMIRYSLYRNLVGQAFALAGKVADFPASSEEDMAVVDPTGKGGGFQYYVTAVNAQGESDPSDAVYDSSPY
jgi:hypothetical protein